MEENVSVAQIFVGTAILLLILYGLWKGGSWVFFEAMDLTPSKLAIASLFVIVTPIVLTLILFTAADNAANSTVAYLSIGVMPIGVLGLVVSGIWHLMAEVF